MDLQIFVNVYFIFYQFHYSVCFFSLFISYLSISLFLFFFSIFFLFLFFPLISFYFSPLSPSTSLYCSCYNTITLLTVNALTTVKESSPYVVVALQECQRMNVLLSEIRRSLIELDKGIKLYPTPIHPKPYTCLQTFLLLYPWLTLSFSLSLCAFLTLYLYLSVPSCLSLSLSLSLSVFLPLYFPLYLSASSFLILSYLVHII